MVVRSSKEALKEYQLTLSTGPVVNINEENLDAFTFDDWVNLNSFVAKLGEDFINYGIWELRLALEGILHEEGPIPDDVVNIRILVATEWITWAGRELLRQSLLNTFQEEPKSWDP